MEFGMGALVVWSPLVADDAELPPSLHAVEVLAGWVVVLDS